MQSTAELHRAVYEAVQSRDFDRLREIYRADCSYATGDGVEQRGVDAVLASVETFTSAFPDLTPSLGRTGASWKAFRPPEGGWRWSLAASRRYTTDRSAGSATTTTPWR